MVADGEPSLSSNNYMNPEAGLIFGVGSDQSGALAYYNILSSVYFKNMATASYGVQAKFYTIGTGVYASTEEAQASVSNYDADEYNKQIAYHDFLRAVLDPTAANINALYDNFHYDASEYVSAYASGDESWGRFKAPTTWIETNLALYALITDNSNLLKEYFGSEVHYPALMVNSLLSMYTYQYINPMVNPYYSISSSGDVDYGVDYVDKSYFGYFSREDMTAIFDEIIDQEQINYDYGFLLADGTDLTVTDPLGEGMEVKGDPILRYYGAAEAGGTVGNSENYSPTNTTTGTDASGNAYTEYTWSKQVWRVYSDAKWNTEHAKSINGDSDACWAAQECNGQGAAYVSLSGIVCRVTTDSATGAQTVTFTIPESAMPTFYPDLHKAFYYEEMPVRLIFKVGLSAEAQAALGASTGAIDAVYYTNAQADAQGAGGTTVEFSPSVDNTYYKARGGQTSAVAKASGANASQTAANVLEEATTVSSSGAISVVQRLGNNGRLSVTRKATDQVSVVKEWPSGVPSGTSSVNVKVYRKATTSGDAGAAGAGEVSLEEYPVASDGNVLVLAAANGWKATFDAPRTATVDGKQVEYEYYVAEEEVLGYTAAYFDSAGGQLEAVTETSDDKVQTGYKIGEFTGYDAAVGGTVTIRNLPAYTLPATGGPGALPFVAAGCALVALAALLALFARRRHLQQ
jgi:hypothetical protein